MNAPKSTTVTVRLTERQAQLVKERVQVDLSEVIRNTVRGDGQLTSRADLNGLRATFDVREGWLDQLDRVVDGAVTWTAPKAEIAAVAVDLVAKGMHASVVADILEAGEAALEEYPARLWLDMAEAAVAIRSQLGNG